MTQTRPGALLLHLRKLLGEQPAGNQPDADLVRRFIADRDEAAFTALLERHGPMVWRVCRQVLGHEQDAEDAFQATFLVLAQRASSLRKLASVASWLYGVAYRVAAQARFQAARKRALPLEEPGMSRQDVLDNLSQAEVQATLHEELARLPHGERAPLVLCYLEGRTQDEAARELGWSKSTVRRKLERGRARLQVRLRCRGLALSLPLLAGLLGASEVSAALPAALLGATVRAALLFHGGLGLGAETISAPVKALVQGVSKVMFPSKVRLVAALFLAVGLASAAAGIAGSSARPTPPVILPRETAAATSPKNDRADKEVEEPAGRGTADKPLPKKASAAMNAYPFQDTNQLRYVAFSPDGKRMAFAGWTKVEAVGYVHALHQREVATGKELWKLDQPGPVRMLAISPNGQFLATCCNQTVTLREAATGKELWALSVKGTDDSLPPEIHSLAFSPDDKNLAAVSVQSRLSPTDQDISSLIPRFTLWEVATGKVIRQSQGDKGMCYQLLGFRAEGKILAWEMKDVSNPGRLVDLKTGEAQFSLSSKQKFIQVTALAPNAKLCAWGSTENGDFSIRLWDMARDKELYQWKGPNGSAVAIAFSPDGKTVAAVSADVTIRLWDVASGKELHVLREHKEYIACLAFSPDGKSLATGGRNQEVFLWDVGTGAIRTRFEGHKGQVESVSFSPDGKLLVSGGSYAGEGNQRINEAFLWDVTSGDRKSPP